MAKKKVLAIVKLQIRAGQATPAPPVGTALGQHGVNIMDFCRQYNEQTQQFAGQVIPAELTKSPSDAAIVRRVPERGRGLAAH